MNEKTGDVGRRQDAVELAVSACKTSDISEGFTERLLALADAIQKYIESGTLPSKKTEA
jgi:hypothetical protein